MPTMLVATVIALFGLPILVPVAVVSDLVRGRFKLPALRVYLFILQYLANDSVEIFAVPLLWLTRATPGQYKRLQWWSVELMRKRADQLLGLRVVLDPKSVAALSEASRNDSRPLIVVSRHVSVLDSTLPSLLVDQANLTSRGVMMAEMLSDPGFDLLYGQLGWVFISRDDRRSALSEIRKLQDAEGTPQAVVIFPEGRIFKPDVRDRALAEIGDTDPDRAERLANLRHTLPPRPGGMLALLELLPNADVLVVSHSGLDDLGEIGRLKTVAPLERQVLVSALRIKRADVPDNPEAQVVWLDELWLGIDAETSTASAVALPRSAMA